MTLRPMLPGLSDGLSRKTIVQVFVFGSRQPGLLEMQKTIGYLCGKNEDLAVQKTPTNISLPCQDLAQKMLFEFVKKKSFTK